MFSFRARYRRYLLSYPDVYTQHVVTVLFKSRSWSWYVGFVANRAVKSSLYAPSLPPDVAIEGRRVANPNA